MKTIWYCWRVQNIYRRWFKNTDADVPGSNGTVF
jgi:hypothetical protein